jgi:hypothetical protein
MMIVSANLIIQVEPATPFSASTPYFTNYAGTNTVISCDRATCAMVPATTNTFDGDVGFLSWRSTTDIVYIQCSIDLIHWIDIRVAHINTTYWYVKPEVPTFYRLRFEHPQQAIVASLKSRTIKAAVEPIVTSFTVTNIPGCDGRMDYYVEGFNYSGSERDGVQHLAGMHVACRYQVTMTWNSESNQVYQILVREKDNSNGEWGVWNTCPQWVTGQGDTTTISFAAAESDPDSFAVVPREMI